MIPPVGSDKCGQVSVSRVDGDAMIPIPCIEDRSACPRWNSRSYLPGRFCVVGLPGTVGVDRLEVHHSPGAAITLGGDEHPGAPEHRGVDRDTLNHPQAYVTIKTSLDLFSPVNWDSCRGVDGDRSGSLIYKQTERGTVIHEGEWLLLAVVERTAGVPVKDVLLQLGEVLLSGCTW